MRSSPLLLRVGYTLNCKLLQDFHVDHEKSVCDRGALVSKLVKREKPDALELSRISHVLLTKLLVLSLSLYCLWTWHKIVRCIAPLARNHRAARGVEVATRERLSAKTDL